MFEDQGLELFHSFKGRIIGNQPRRLRLNGGSGLQCVRRSETMCRANPGGYICDDETRCDPIEIGISSQEPIEFIHLPFIRVPVRLNEQLCHSDGRSNGRMPRMFEPGEDRICQIDIARVRFQLVNKDASIDSNTPVTAQEAAETR